MSTKTIQTRDGRELRVIPEGHPRRMADAKNAWRKMSTAQRDAFLSSLGGPVGARPMALWSVTLLEDRGEMPRLEFFETKAQAAARVFELHRLWTGEDTAEQLDQDGAPAEQVFEELADGGARVWMSHVSVQFRMAYHGDGSLRVLNGEAIQGYVRNERSACD